MKNFICEFNGSGVAYLNLQFKPFFHDMHFSKKVMTYSSFPSKKTNNVVGSGHGTA